ncbi:MAG: hypothetical protein KGM24_02810 [Elusimicrobia bacterium]|nr:hypothetical protein [Elusimicrobiota bacterium]
MKRLLPAVLLAAAAACAPLRADIRYSPSAPVSALAPARLVKVASIEYKDSSRGLESLGTGLLLTRPFFDTFRAAAAGQLATLGVSAAGGDGTAVVLELKKAELKRPEGLISTVSATVAYALRARLPDGASCVQDVTGWASQREGVVSSPAAKALEGALGKALDDLGPAVRDSCLYAAESSTAAASAPRSGRFDGKLLVVAIGPVFVGSADVAAENARYFAAAAKSELGAGDIIVLAGTDVTLAALNKTFGKTLGDRVADGGRVVVYFAGDIERDHSGTYLLPRDADSSDLSDTAYPLARLYGDLARLPAKVTLILDANSSGSGPEARPPRSLTVLSSSASGKPGDLTAVLLRELKAKNGDLAAAVAAVRAGETR